MAMGRRPLSELPEARVGRSPQRAAAVNENLDIAWHTPIRAILATERTGDAQLVVSCPSAAFTKVKMRSERATVCSQSDSHLRSSSYQIGVQQK
jgi:hypothetical protein